LVALPSTVCSFAPSQPHPTCLCPLSPPPTHLGGGGTNNTTPHPSAAQIVAPLSPGAAALSAGSQEDAGAVVVDEYARDAKTGAWRLDRVASCVADFLAEQGVRAALVPDVRAAAAAGLDAAAASNAVRDAACGYSPQSTNHVLMVAPTAFGFNEQAAQDNSFMHQGERASEGGSSLTRQVGGAACRAALTCDGRGAGCGPPGHEAPCIVHVPPLSLSLYLYLYLCVTHLHFH